jgi:hypothetical protein
VEAYAKCFNVYVLQFIVTDAGAELIDMQRPLHDTGYNKIIGIAICGEMFDCLLAVEGCERIFERNMRTLVTAYLSSGEGMQPTLTLKNFALIITQ